MSSKPKTELVTVPMFIYKQGDPFLGEGNCEYPIEIKYYNGVISLEQDGKSINILPEHLGNLFKAIKTHLPEANKKLKNK